jgi:RNA polymerase sigma-70 factor (ECF subfamily)
MQMPFDAGDQSDEALLAAYGRGEARAARMLTDRLLPGAWRMLGDEAEAEDVAQEAMMRLWRIAPEWRTGEARVTTWLYRVTVNLCTDRMRRRRGVALDAVPEPEDGAPGAAAGLMQADRMAALEAALALLPDRQRQAVVLRHLEGLANPEIAEIMGLGVEAVESLTARGKRNLAAALAGRKEDLGYDDA